jgi:hypothetical protein
MRTHPTPESDATLFNKVIVTQTMLYLRAISPSELGNLSPEHLDTLTGKIKACLNEGNKLPDEHIHESIIYLQQLYLASQEGKSRLPNRTA